MSLVLVACGGGGGGGGGVATNSGGNSLRNTVSETSQAMRSDNVTAYSLVVDNTFAEKEIAAFNLSSKSAKTTIAGALDNVTIPSIPSNQNIVTVDLKLPIPNSNDVYIATVTFKKQPDGSWKIYKF
jgi:hypothetical protein